MNITLFLSIRIVWNLFLANQIVHTQYSPQQYMRKLFYSKSDTSFYISFLLLIMTLLAILFVSDRDKPVVVETNLENLPHEINGLMGETDYFDEAVYKELNADFNVYRHYINENAEQIDLYIGYYGTAKGGRTHHEPLLCLPSQGWVLIDSKEILIKPESHPQGVYVNYLLALKDDLHMNTIYWYQSAGNKVLSNGVKQNLQRFSGLIFENRNDGALIRVTNTSPIEDTQESLSKAILFSQQIMNILPDYWPVEK